jgi:hypothetical protein
MYTPKGSAYGLGGPRKGSRPNTPLSGSLRTPLLVGRLKTSSQGGSTPLSRWEIEAWEKHDFDFGRSHDNYLCTNDLYGPVRNVFDAGRYLRGEVVGGLALEISSFVGPCEMARADRRVLFGA